MTRPVVFSIRFLYYINTVRAINLDGGIKNALNNIAKLDIILDSLAFYSM